MPPDISRGAQPFALASRETFLSASIGVCLAPGPGRRPAELIRDADAAMYRAKRGGSGRFAVSVAELRPPIVTRRPAA